MIIKDDTITFKSYPENYVKEKSGVKPNTVRWLTPHERDELQAAKEKLTRIRIVETPPKGAVPDAAIVMDSFTRELTDIHEVTSQREMGERKYLYVFSWKDVTPCTCPSCSGIEDASDGYAIKPRTTKGIKDV